jgi:hypothetical protein
LRTEVAQVSSHTPDSLTSAFLFPQDLPDFYSPQPTCQGPLRCQASTAPPSTLPLLLCLLMTL